MKEGGHNTFPCTKCGACCSNVGIAIKQLKENGIEFPYKAGKDGACEMLENNICKVYDNRPNIYRIDDQAKLLRIKKEVYYRESILACNELMDYQGVPQEFRIKL